jgi:multicomponent K+:H+ antiporter subunit E
MNATRTEEAKGFSLFPHPILSFSILVVWLLLVNSIHPRMILLGSVMAVLIPQFTRLFWADKPRIYRPGALLRFIPVFIWDILVANLQVAWLILNAGRKLRPSWVVVPLDITNPYAITTLAAVISLTPGTVSSEFGPGRRTLLVHSLDVDDPEALVKGIKDRYERPLKEIFEC